MSGTRTIDHGHTIKTLKKLTWSLLALFAVLAMVSMWAQEPVKPASRAEATAIIANARKIVTPNGVERMEKVRIGGIDQWVSVRGVARRNPVLLYIHGGPGYVSIPMSWWFSRCLEEYFTVIQWDQRATGKTFLLTDPGTIVPTLTREHMITDTEEMADWARTEFGKDKIFVLGHSWGSFLGSQLAQRHPEWFYAYIGVGQLIVPLEEEKQIPFGDDNQKSMTTRKADAKTGVQQRRLRLSGDLWIAGELFLRDQPIGHELLAVISANGEV